LTPACTVVILDSAAMGGDGLMSAVVYDRYGPPEVLRFEDVEQPAPREGEVLVKIHATTLNRTDGGWRTWRPSSSVLFSVCVNRKGDSSAANWAAR
jgi:hypothetical protein